MRVFALKGIGNDGVRRNTEMKRQRVENKLNRRNREEVIGGGGIAGMVCIALIIVFTNLFVMPVQAEPATLKSQEATVYEQSNEESAPVGNLVEGGSFEYMGDVTAEDGSIWHQITMAGGITGYIRGDREIETGIQTQDPVPKEQEAPAEEDNNGEAVDNSPEEDTQEGQVPLEDGGEEEPVQSDDGEDDETASEDGEEALNEDETVPVINMQNNQTKKYLVDSSKKIRDREHLADTEMNVKVGTDRRTRVDIALIVSIAVMLFCGGMIYICWTRMMRLKKGSGEAEEVNRNKTHRRIDRKRHNQKRKSTKVIQRKKRV